MTDILLSRLATLQKTLDELNKDPTNNNQKIIEVEKEVEAIRIKFQLLQQQRQQEQEQERLQQPRLSLWGHPPASRNISASSFKSTLYVPTEDEIQGIFPSPALRPINAPSPPFNPPLPQQPPPQAPQPPPQAPQLSLQPLNYNSDDDDNDSLAISFKERIARYARRLKDVSSELTPMIEEHQKYIKTLKDEHEARLKTLISEHETGIKLYEEEHQQKIKNLIETQENAREKLNYYTESLKNHQLLKTPKRVREEQRIKEEREAKRLKDQEEFNKIDDIPKPTMTRQTTTIESVAKPPAANRQSTTTNNTTFTLKDNKSESSSEHEEAKDSSDSEGSEESVDLEDKAAALLPILYDTFLKKIGAGKINEKRKKWKRYVIKHFQEHFLPGPCISYITDSVKFDKEDKVGKGRKKVCRLCKKDIVHGEWYCQFSEKKRNHKQCIENLIFPMSYLRNPDDDDDQSADLESSKNSEIGSREI